MTNPTGNLHLYDMASIVRMRIWAEKQLLTSYLEDLGTNGIAAAALTDKLVSK